MLVLGLTGPIGHGKSTLANAFLSLDKSAVRLESSTIITEVANEWLKQFPERLLVDDHDLDNLEAWTTELSIIASRRLRVHIQPEQLFITEKTFTKEPETVKQLLVYVDLVRQGVVEMNTKIEDSNKDKNRAILQWLGGFLIIRVGKGIWYDEIERRIIKAETEAKSLCIVGGIRYPYDAEVIRRNGGKVAEIVRKDLPKKDTSDMTEQQREKIKPDFIVRNRSSRKALTRMAKAIYEDLLNDDILPEYDSEVFCDRV